VPLLIALGVALLGHDAAHPKRRSLVVLTLLVTAALGCGWALQKAIDTALLPPLDKTLVFFSCIAITSLSISLSIILSYAGFRPKDTVSKLLWYLPLRPLQRWLYLQAPIYLGGVITLITICPSLSWLARNMGISSFYCSIALIIGVVGAYGFFHACHTSSAALPVVCLGIIVAIELFGLQQFAHDPTSLTWKLVLTGIYACKNLGWLFCSRRAKTNYTSKRAAHMIGRQLPSTFWYLKKVLRASLLNASICLLLCLGIATYCWRLSLQDAEMVSTVASLIIASFVSDLRGLCRARSPAEITALRGTNYFVIHYLTTGILAGLTIAPLLIFLVVLDSPLFCYLQPLLGIAAGSLAGACVVPRPRDISGQCFAVLLSIVFVTLPPRFFSSLNPLSLLASEVGVLVAFIFVVEYLRNPFTWRKS